MSVIIVLVSTGLAEILYRMLGTTRLSMIFLAGVVVSAVTQGSGPAYLAAGLAFTIYDFYLAEPRFSFQFGSSENAIILIVFLIVAMLTGNLAGRIRDEERRASLRARTTNALFQASREFASAADINAIRAGLARHIAEAARDQAAVWHDGETWTAPSDTAVPSAVLAVVRKIGRADVSETVTLPVGDWRVRPMRAAGEHFGVAAWRGAEPGRGAEEEAALIDVLVDLGATSIARTRLADARAEIEALARTEHLRSTLLSSISHDLRTPLAAILASASGLREFGPSLDADIREDLVVTIQEEAERLNLFVGNLLNMTRLEAGALKISASPVNLSEVVDRVINRCASRRGERELIWRNLNGAQAWGDPVLLEHALTNVVDNAIRFTPDGTMVDICARDQDGQVVIDVSDQGDGVPARELARIFEKFYRGQGTEKIPGTGLGLSITKGLVEAMGGAVSAKARKFERGLVVSLKLPRHA